MKNKIDFKNKKFLLLVFLISLIVAFLAGHYLGPEKIKIEYKERIKIVEKIIRESTVIEENNLDIEIIRIEKPDGTKIYKKIIKKRDLKREKSIVKTSKTVTRKIEKTTEIINTNDLIVSLYFPNLHEMVTYNQRKIRNIGVLVQKNIKIILPVSIGIGVNANFDYMLTLGIKF